MRRRRLTLLAVLVTVAGCAMVSGEREPPRAARGLVDARLVVGDHPVPGARISAVRDLGVMFREAVNQVTAATGGRALLTLPAGTYYLMARSVEEGAFGYYGPNPVQVRSGERLEVAIRGQLADRPPQVSKAADRWSGIEGEVESEDGPLGAAVVAIYLDATGQFRGPAYVEVETDGEGRFEASISPGRYFVVVRKRAVQGRNFGPLEVGDHFGYYGFNPVRIREGERATIRMGAIRVLKKVGWARSSTLRTQLRGTIRDSSGRPLAGYTAFLHVSSEMLGRPEFVSEPSGPDGRYAIWVDKAGTYYLGARKGVGQARKEGEILGYYRGNRTMPW